MRGVHCLLVLQPGPWEEEVSGLLTAHACRSMASPPVCSCAGDPVHVLCCCHSAAGTHVSHSMNAK